MKHKHQNQKLAVATVTSRHNARMPSARGTALRAGIPLLFALLISGCATGGIYRNQSTPDRIDVVATEQAAVEAAKSAQSQVGMSNQAQGGYQGGAYRGAAYSPPSPYQQLQNNVSQALVNSASSALSGAIYSLVNRVAYR
jgi:hypothetical protein